MASIAFADTAPPALAESPASSSKYAIEYKTSSEALAALKKKKGVSIREENDWFVINDQSENAIWSIATENSRAYPTMVKRVVYEKDKSLMVSLEINCGADKATCDEVASVFKQINEQVRNAMNQKL